MEQAALQWHQSLGTTEPPRTCISLSLTWVLQQQSKFCSVKGKQNLCDQDSLMLPSVYVICQMPDVLMGDLTQSGGTGSCSSQLRSRWVLLLILETSSIWAMKSSHPESLHSQMGLAGHSDICVYHRAASRWACPCLWLQHSTGDIGDNLCHWAGGSARAHCWCHFSPCCSPRWRTLGYVCEGHPSQRHLLHSGAGQAQTRSHLWISGGGCQRVWLWRAKCSFCGSIR